LSTPISSLKVAQKKEKASMAKQKVGKATIDTQKVAKVLANQKAEQERPFAWVYRAVDNEGTLLNDCNHPGAVAFAVGFYAPDGEWVEESKHNLPETAANRAHFLNGKIN
jgi:hypothetical protein